MAGLVDQLRAAFEMPIDFEGQRKAEQYTQLILVSSAVIGFVVGFILQNLTVTMAIYAAGFVVALVVVCPPWPMYNKHPLSWLPASSSPSSDEQQQHQQGAPAGQAPPTESKKKR